MTTKNMISFVVGISILSLVFPVESFGASLIDAKIDSAFSLKIGEIADIKSEQLTILLSEIEDSRCPTDVTCVWEGEVIIKLNVKKGGEKSKESLIEIKTSQSPKAFLDNYSIELLKVEPQPISKSEIKKEQYRAMLLVELEKLPAPLKQFKKGIPIDQIQCKESLILVQKNNGTPACIKPEHSNTLILRGWIEPDTIPAQKDPEIAVWEIAREFILASPTYSFDGIEETLSIEIVAVMESFPEQYQVEAKYDSRHGGYGDRTDLIVTQVITPHKVDLRITGGKVISAINDGRYDELNDLEIVKEPSDSNDLSLHVAPVHDYNSLLDALEDHDIIAELVDEISDSSFGVPTKVLEINDEDVQVFEFSSSTDAQKASLLVSEDGTQIGNSVIRWIDTPHFYTQDKLIVLYVGHTPEIIELLKSLLDEQFAGM